ncbi:3'-5' exonuclease [Paenibacillus tyrfis]|uniref:3'-5' exonuclease n=1 Tax=Paenibacillus tyrfis TaxID=1501230 RepID=UPI000B58E8C6|nr:3'-5' exonuclease [Paenibacillus tyrfis]
MIYENTTIFDFETTGLDPSYDKIIELALIRIRNGKVVGTLNYLINPETVIPHNITDITGITNDDVCNCPTIKQLLPWMMAIIGDSLLVAHNALFDLTFLDVANQKYRGKSVNNSFIDTRAICIDRFPYESHRLELMCNKYQIRLDGAHRALNDVSATWELLQKLDQEKTVEDYLNKIYYFKKHGVPNWMPEHARIVGL